jgi:hypothetical protein
LLKYVDAGEPLNEVMEIEIASGKRPSIPRKLG